MASLGHNPVALLRLRLFDVSVGASLVICNLLIGIGFAIFYSLMAPKCQWSKGWEDLYMSDQLFMKETTVEHMYLH